jgi:hypothetical protein
VRFKDQTDKEDIVLILRELEPDITGLDFAQVKEFTEDVSKKDPWFHVDLILFNLPLDFVTFILKEEHFTGREIFTMRQKEVFIQALDTTKPREETPEDGTKNTGTKGGHNFTLIR